MAKKRTLEQVFRDTLGEMATATPDGRVGSNALEAKLAWNVKGRYAKIRKDLINKSQVSAHPGGAGGKLQLVSKAVPAAAVPLNAFVSYCHADADLKVELLKHLEPLRRLGLVDHWHDGDISAGQDWEKAIMNRLRGADLIILLVTADFINSKYCYDTELTAAVERHKAKRARVVPVIGRNCLWQYAPFSQIQAALNGKAIMTFPNRDEALTELAKEVKLVAEQLRTGRAPSA